MKLSCLPLLSSTTTVGNNWTLYFSPSLLLAFFCSAEMGLLLGKSTRTRTRLSLAKSLNSLVEKTFLCSSLQGGHQSDPVKSIRTSFFSCLASCWALAKSVSQLASSARAAWTSAASVSRANPTLVIALVLFYGNV